MIELLLALVLSVLPGETVTGYTPFDCTEYQDRRGWCDGWTTGATRATPGRTVACPDDIPLGSLVFIEGVGWRTCEDRGCDCFDVFVPDTLSAYRITGERRVLVLVDRDR